MQVLPAGSVRQQTEQSAAEVVGQLSRPAQALKDQLSPCCIHCATQQLQSQMLIAKTPSCIRMSASHHAVMEPSMQCIFKRYHLRLPRIQAMLELDHTLKPVAPRKAGMLQTFSPYLCLFTWTSPSVSLSVGCYFSFTDCMHTLATNANLQQRGVYSITHQCMRRQQDLNSEHLCQAGSQPAMEVRRRDAASLISGCTAVFCAEFATDCSEGTSTDSREPESSTALSLQATQIHHA